MNTVSFNRDLFPSRERRTLLSTCGFKAQLKLTPDRPVSKRHRSNSVGARNFWRLLFSNSLTADHLQGSLLYFYIQFTKILSINMSISWCDALNLLKTQNFPNTWLLKHLNWTPTSATFYEYEWGGSRLKLQDTLSIPTFVFYSSGFIIRTSLRLEYWILRQSSTS